MSLSLSADKPDVNLDATSEPDSPLAASAAGLSVNNAPGSNVSSPSTSKPPRVLACLLCQQRKIKCDRKFPCANCARAGAKCVPAGLVPRQRRRRFPERELLDRIRNYEGLLRQNHVAFEPLHPSAQPAAGPAGKLSAQSADAASSATGPQRPGTKLRPANLWTAISQKVKGNPSEDDGDVEDDSDDETDSGFLHIDDDLRGAAIKKAWTNTYEGAEDNSQHLLFGSPASTNHVSLTSSHPDQTGIFQLWQIYLENVDPLLKITHAPTMQARIVDAIRDLAAIAPPFEALLFAIYCTSILSIDDDQCQVLFGSLKLDLLASYQFACRQALVNCQFLQCDEYDCLAALYLYLLTIKAASDPRALSSMLAVAIRIAQRLSYYKEASNAKCNALEAELHRRLWWSLVIYDNRVCETFQTKTATLGPTWDCSVPHNLSDFELRPESKVPPPTSDKPTEALFVAMRSELSDFLRHTPFHCDFIDPLLTTFAHAKKTTPNPPSSSSSYRDLPDLQKAMEERFKLCDMENPLHSVTVWTTRALIAKFFLLERIWRDDSSPAQQGARAQANFILPYCFEMLDCDTRIMSSPLTKRFRWYMQFQFQFLAYAYMLQDMKKWPTEDYHEQAWQAMSDNYEARGMHTFQTMHKPFYILFSRMVLLAWEAREAAPNRGSKPSDPPRIVVDIRGKLPALLDRASGGELGASSELPVTLSDPPATMPVDVAGSDTTAAGGMPFAAPGMPPGYQDMTGPAMLNNMVGMDQLWPAMNWGIPHQRPWYR